MNVCEERGCEVAGAGRGIAEVEAAGRVEVIVRDDERKSVKKGWWTMDARSEGGKEGRMDEASSNFAPSLGN